ncbi:MAG: HAD hydrolase-like protein [Tissierellia bacterium]|nr:HAD hydrolase-like protein [Tissierellia bacterium]
MDILLDLDGTIIKSEQGVVNAVMYALDNKNIEYDRDELIEFIGPPLWDQFGLYLEEAEIQSAVDDFRKYYMDKGKFECELYDGIEDALAKLSKDNRVFLATSKSEVYAVEILEHFGIDKYFTDFFCATHDGKIAYKVDILKKAKEKYDFIKPMMVGDRASDMKAAIDTQMLPVAATYGYGSLLELKNAQAQKFINSPMELLELL